MKRLILSVLLIAPSASLASYGPMLTAQDLLGVDVLTAALATPVSDAPIATACVMPAEATVTKSTTIACAN